jgi:hypothetical protein
VVTGGDAPGRGIGAARSGVRAARGGPGLPPRGETGSGIGRVWAVRVIMDPLVDTRKSTDPVLTDAVPTGMRRRRPKRAAPAVGASDMED